MGPPLAGRALFTQSRPLDFTLSGPGVELEPLIEAGNRALLRGLRQLKPGFTVDATDYLESCVVEEIEALVFAPK